MFKSKGNASVWVIVVLLIIAAILLFAFSDSDGDDNGAATSTTDETVQPAPPTGEAATAQEVQAALEADGSVQCAFSSEAGDSSASYVSNGQIRVMSESDGVTTNMVFVDGDIYVWEDGATEGISFNADSFPQYSDGAMLPARPADITEGVASGNVSCSVVEVEESMFTLPQSVTFASYATSSMESDSETGGQIDDRN